MGRKTKYSHDNDDEIARKYTEEKVSLSALSKEFGIPVMTIKRRLIKKGVEIRNFKTAMGLLKKTRASDSSDVDERIQRVTGVVQFEDQNEQPPMTDEDEWIS